jgi:8-oxo-dGTP pyrophosphatase MutT (NUDIX family)
MQHLGDPIDTLDGDRIGSADCTNATVCFIRRDNKVLLQERTAGRRWAGILNGPGGKIEDNETPLAAVTREIAEETSLRLDDVTAHGTVRLIFDGAKDRHLLVHVFSASRFVGRPRAVEGPLRWFREDRLPFDRMWPDQRYWLPLVLAGGRLDVVCLFDAAGRVLRSCRLQLRLP